MVYWAPVLHFYQPPTQFPAVLKRICDESYRPLIEVLGEFDGARATVNINGSLTEMLQDCGHADIVGGLRRLAEEGRIEFTGSAMYHPILPLIPPSEILRQVELNYATNRRAFGDAYAPEGFFPPELAYGPTIPAAVARTNHRWVLAAGVACPAGWPIDVIHTVEACPELAVLYRDDVVSNRVSFRNVDGFGFIDHLRSVARPDRPTYVVTAMDAETFGHHVRDWDRQFLAHVFAQFEYEPRPVPELEAELGLAKQHRLILESTEREARLLQVVTVSQLLDLFPAGVPSSPRASSWSTSGDDLARGVAYPLWCDPSNETQSALWRHLQVCIEFVGLASSVASGKGRPYAAIARGLLDQAFHSCQFWWASRRPMWDLNMIERGLSEQRAVVLNAAKCVALSAAGDDGRRRADDLYAIAEQLSRRVRQQVLETEV